MPPKGLLTCDLTVEAGGRGLFSQQCAEIGSTKYRAALPSREPSSNRGGISEKLNCKMAFPIERLKRLPTRLFVDPLEPVLPRLAGYPRVDEGVPAGHRLYVIGDIHGCIDLLRQKHARIEADVKTGGAGVECAVIYLGDYIDGGPSSRDVIETVMGDAPKGTKKITLMGNHERLLLDFLDDAGAGEKWLELFGRTTIESYGVTVPPGHLGHEQLLALQSSLRGKLPKKHIRFLKSLRPFHICGDYAFVHAGIRPGTAISDQSPEDLLWIRNEFLSSRLEHEKVIVHGHSFSRRPRVRAYRMGIDTGSFFTGRLTCLVLEQRTHRFL